MATKSNLLILFLSLFLCSELSAQMAFKNNEVTITKLEKNMWVVETADNTTMYIVEGTKKAMLIDTGTKTEKLDSIISLITKKPLIVMLTHLHPDHAGNVKYFKEIYYHPADSVLINPMGINFQGKANYVSDKQIFDLGETSLEVMLTPGHTPGSIVLIDRNAGNCYSGDAFGSGQVWMQLNPHISMAIYAESCRKMEALMNNGISRIYCGHYPYVKHPYDISYITDMRMLAEQLSNNIAPEGKPYSTAVHSGSQLPMITTLGSASIVYDPEHIN